MLSTSVIKIGLYTRIGRRAVIVMFGFSVLYSTIVNSQSLASPHNSIEGNVRVIARNGNELEDRSNVIIFIDGLTLPQRDQEQKIIPKISHKGQWFSPRVVPIVKGAIIDFFNDDDIYHNVFSLSKANTFDLGIYPKGTSKLVAFNQSGLIKIYCNIHPKMVSNILVLNNSLFAKTSTDGSFKIENIPDGEFTLRVWYEFSDEHRQQVSLQGGKLLTKNLAIKATKKVGSHKNKFGKPYRNKY